jgi:hypothetical protein
LDLIRWSALLGPVFLAGSIVALRNRKRAGIIFLICMPVAVLCLGYPSGDISFGMPMAAVGLMPPAPHGHWVNDHLLPADLCCAVGNPL